MFLAGLGVFTVSSAVCALADSIAMLDAARAVQGLGAAAMFAVSLALLAQAYPGMRERAALAIYGATIGASFAIGPLVGGVVTSGLGWRWIFALNIPFGILAIAATVSRVQESRDPHARSIDWIGQTVLGGGLFLLVLALLRANDQGWGSSAIISELSGAAVLLAAFAFVEQRVKGPMLPLEFFRNRRFTATQAGTIGISASFFALFLVAAGMLLMMLAGVHSSWTIILPGEIIALIGTGLFNPAMSGVAMSALPERHSGLASGAYDTFRQAGMAVGIAALGALIPAGAALGHGSPQAYVDGLREALAVGAFIALAGAFAVMHLLRERNAVPAVAEAAVETA